MHSVSKWMIVQDAKLKSKDDTMLLVSVWVNSISWWIKAPLLGFWNFLVPFWNKLHCWKCHLENDSYNLYRKEISATSTQLGVTEVWRPCQIVHFKLKLLVAINISNQVIFKALVLLHGSLTVVFFTSTHENPTPPYSFHIHVLSALQCSASYM